MTNKKKIPILESRSEMNLGLQQRIEADTLKLRRQCWKLV
jgi:hypothetical protein